MLQIPETEEAKPFLDHNQDHSESHHTCTCTHKSQGRRFVSQTLPWMISAISWLVMFGLLFSRQTARNETSDLPTNVIGTSHIATNDSDSTPLSNTQSPINAFFPTDFEDARSFVEYETRTFTGALLWNETTKRFFRNITTEEPQYVGPPSDAIDEAWEIFLKNEWTSMTDEEVKPYLPEIKIFNGGYLFEPDMFHSLHCLNEVRKRIDMDYYSNSEHDGIHIEQDDWDRIHIDHCLDQLRQTITCFGDLSPVPLYSWDGAPAGIGRGTEHTCRKLEPIQKWVDGRHSGKGSA